MIIHDRKTEKELIRIAAEISDPESLDKPDIRWWTGLWNKWSALVAIFVGVSAFLWFFSKDEMPSAVNVAVCGIIMMFIIKLGASALDSAIKHMGFFTTMVNLPIAGRTALTYIRSRFVLNIWMPVTAFTIVIAAATNAFPPPSEGYRVLSTTILLLWIVSSTVTLAGTPLFNRLRLSFVWHIVAIAILIQFLYMHYVRDDIFGATSVEMAIISHATWIFPPTWVFPGRLETGGAILAAIWGTLGLWKWITWPAAAFPPYDFPDDFFGAFGSFGYDEESWLLPEDNEDITESESGESTKAEDLVGTHSKLSKDDLKIDFEPALGISESGWLSRLFLTAIRKDHRTIAGICLDPDANWTPHTNLAMILAPLWLLITWLVKDLIPNSTNAEMIHAGLWILPVGGFILLLLPFTNAVPRGLGSWDLGGIIVPLFSGLPVSTMSLKHVSLRITLARALVMALIGAPFYWLMAHIYGMHDVAFGMLALIPAISLFFACSRPIFLWNRLRRKVRARRSSLLPMLLVSLSHLFLITVWFLTGIAGITCSFFWASGIGDPVFRDISLPIALIGLFLSFACARAVFGVFALTLRKRLLDWSVKPD